MDKFNVIDNQVVVIHSVIVHRFSFPDTLHVDPSLTLKNCISEWSNTDSGKFINTF